MRVTTSFPLGTLRDTPSEAEIISHQLLLKGGYIRRVNSGIYAYMPIMLRVIEKISTIIEKELNDNHCSKLLLPQLHPADLWKKSGLFDMELEMPKKEEKKAPKKAKKDKGDK